MTKLFFHFFIVSTFFLGCTNRTDIQDRNLEKKMEPRVTKKNTKEMPSDTCQVNKLYGVWVYINNYSGRLTEIDTLKKEPFKSKFGNIILTYYKNGKYLNDQGDYSTEGRFKIDLNKCIIDQFEYNSNEKDTSTFQITYLDRDYLLLVKMNKENQSYFYKRN